MEELAAFDASGAHSRHASLPHLAPEHAQELRREFRLWSSFSLAFAFISPIVALYGIFGLAIGAGGPGFWWGFPVVLAGQLLVALVFAELVSVWPLEGSVYQWARKLLGPRFGWFAGWAYMWTLVIAMAAVAYGAAGFLATVFGIANPSRTTLLLLAVGVLVFGTAANTIGRRLLKVMVALSIAAEVIGSLGIGTVLLIFHRVNPLHVIFQGVGGGHHGLYLTGPFLAAMAFIGWSFVGFESAGAIAEEVHNPRREVPKAIIFSLVFVALVVMYSSLALVLAIPNLDAVLAGKVADPVAETMRTHLGAGITKPLFSLFVIGFTASFLALQAAVSRVIWAFARDRALPASRALRKLSDKDKLPINAILVTAVVSGALFLISGSNIYSVLVSFTTGGFYIAFAFPVIGAVYARLRGRWRPGPFSLGRWSAPVTYVALIWVVFETVNIAWPRTPSMPWYENWGVVVMVVVLGLLGAIVLRTVSSRMATGAEVTEVVHDLLPAPVPEQVLHVERETELIARDHAAWTGEAENSA